MGAHGGAVKVTVWRCTTCRRDYDRSDGGKKSAVECCNEAVERKKAYREDARVERAAKKIRATMEMRSYYNGVLNATRYRLAAVARCPAPKCFAVRAVWVTKECPRETALRMAKLQIRRHLRRDIRHRAW